jgi:hypothetical protein
MPADIIRFPIKERSTGEVQKFEGTWGNSALPAGFVRPEGWVPAEFASLLDKLKIGQKLNTSGPGYRPWTTGATFGVFSYGYWAISTNDPDAIAACQHEVVRQAKHGWLVPTKRDYEWKRAVLRTSPLLKPLLEPEKDVPAEFARILQAISRSPRPILEFQFEGAPHGIGLFRVDWWEKLPDTAVFEEYEAAICLRELNRQVVAGRMLYRGEETWEIFGRSGD